jgi:hypothetical protein
MPKPLNLPLGVGFGSDFFEDRKAFFAAVGECITAFQTIDDYLSSCFHAAAGGSEARAAAIFKFANSLEAKNGLIAAALIDRTAELQAVWADLQPRIKFAADNRNQIAHANPQHVGSTVILSLDAQGEWNQPLYDDSTQRMELIKRTKNGQSIWTTAQLNEEIERLRRIFQNQIAFVQILNGQTVSDHLVEDWAVVHRHQSAIGWTFRFKPVAPDTPAA